MAQNEEESPFHESIVVLIREARPVDMRPFARLIKITGIPQNHDVIDTVWHERCAAFGMTDDLGVSAALAEKKREAEEKAAAKLAQVAADAESGALMLGSKAGYGVGTLDSE
jgi:hypothetical protein